uniref:hypothetical protein n=1 Tax=Demequina sp. TaxID=2050685 RepID=UPI0025E94B14
AHGIVLAATDSDPYNALVARDLGAELGHHRAFQLAPTGEAASERGRLAFDRRAAYAFDGRAGLAYLDARLAEGWRVRATPLTKEYGWRELAASLGGRGMEAVPIGAVDASGRFRVFARSQAFVPARGSTMVYLAPASA